MTRIDLERAIEGAGCCRRLAGIEQPLPEPHMGWHVRREGRERLADRIAGGVDLATTMLDPRPVIPGLGLVRSPAHERRVAVDCGGIEPVGVVDHAQVEEGARVRRMLLDPLEAAGDPLRERRVQPVETLGQRRFGGSRGRAAEEPHSHHEQQAGGESAPRRHGETVGLGQATHRARHLPAALGPVK